MKLGAPLRLPSSQGTASSKLRALSSRSDAIHVTDTDRLRSGLLGERQARTDIAIIIRAAHPEATSDDGTIHSALGSQSGGWESGEEKSGEQVAHHS